MGFVRLYLLDNDFVMYPKPVNTHRFGTQRNLLGELRIMPREVGTSYYISLLKQLCTIVSSVVLSAVFLSIALSIGKPTGVTLGKVIAEGELVSQVVPAKPTRIRDIGAVRKEDAVGRLADYIRDESTDLQEDQARSISEILIDESDRYNVDYRLVLALVKVESNFKCGAISKKGARGLLQIKPYFAKYVAEDTGVGWQGHKTLDEPEKNIKIGIHILSNLIEDFQSIHMAIHAYHVGPTKLRQMLAKSKAPKEHYVNLVLGEYKKNTSFLPAP